MTVSVSDAALTFDSANSLDVGMMRQALMLAREQFAQSQQRIDLKRLERVRLDQQGYRVYTIRVDATPL